MMTDFEKEYVHQVYSRLASYIRPSSPCQWPGVKQFLERLPPGSIVADIGCGESKYRVNNGLLIGFDACSEVLNTVTKKDGMDVVVSDALHIPIRSNSADAALLVCVLHHFSSASRRRAVLEETARVLRSRGRVLIYVWALEQPNASFASQDVLVPWNLHELSINGRLPKTKFHMDSTKEQRIIRNSLPVKVDSVENEPGSWLSSLVDRIVSIAKSAPTPQLPPSMPNFLPNPRRSIISRLRKYSPSLARRLSFQSVEDELGDELAEKILHDALTEAIAQVAEVTFYRYYHVFKRGELEDAINDTDTLTVISSRFDHGHWCVLAEKLAPPENRVI